MAWLPFKGRFLVEWRRILNNRKEFVSHWYKLFFVVGYALQRPRLLLQLRCICTLWRIYRRCNWPLFASNTCAIKEKTYAVAIRNIITKQPLLYLVIYWPFPAIILFITFLLSNSCKLYFRRGLVRTKKGVFNMQEGHVLGSRRASSWCLKGKS